MKGSPASPAPGRGALSEGPALLHASDLISGAPLGSILGILGTDTFKDMLLRGAGAEMVMNFPIQHQAPAAD